MVQTSAPRSFFIDWRSIRSVVGTVLTAPLWLPTYVGIVVLRWLLGRDQSNDA